MGCFTSRKQKYINGNTSVVYDNVSENPTITTNNDQCESPRDVTAHRPPRISAMLTSANHLALLNQLGEIPDEEDYDVITPPNMEVTERENKAFINSLENPKKCLQD